MHNDLILQNLGHFIAPHPLLILFVTPHVVKEFGEYLKEPRSNKIYSPGNREVKKGPELRGTERSEELERLKIHNPSDPII